MMMRRERLAAADEARPARDSHHGTVRCRQQALAAVEVSQWSHGVALAAARVELARECRYESESFDASALPILSFQF